MNPACQKIWQTQSARRLMRRNGSFIDLYGIIGRALSKEQQHIFANTKGAEATVSFHDFEIKDRFVELARAAHIGDVDAGFDDAAHDGNVAWRSFHRR